MYSPTLFSRRNFAGRDLLVYKLPIEKAVHDAYSRGSLQKWREEIGPLEAARALPGLAHGEVVIESGRQGRGDARPGGVRVVVNTPAALRFETNSPDPTWLFVLRGFWGYRDVRVDGILVETVPAQIAFSAVPLPAGRHRVDWTERLPGSEISRWGPALFALLMAGLLARERWRRA